MTGRTVGIKLTREQIAEYRKKWNVEGGTDSELLRTALESSPGFMKREQYDRIRELNGEVNRLTHTLELEKMKVNRLTSENRELRAEVNRLTEVNQGLTPKVNQIKKDIHEVEKPNYTSNTPPLPPPPPMSMNPEEYIAPEPVEGDDMTDRELADLAQKWYNTLSDRMGGAVYGKPPRFRKASTRLKWYRGRTVALHKDCIRADKPGLPPDVLEALS